VIIHSAAIVLAFGFSTFNRGLEVWSADFVVVYPDGTETTVENDAEIRPGDPWGDSSYLIERLELEPRGSHAGDRVRAILRRR
jgi:hypothetical protein